MSDTNKAFSLARMARHDANALRAMLDPALVVDAIFGFHAQQAVEKSLKAWLAALKVEFPLTHDLIRLLDLIEAEGEDVENFLALARFTIFAVQARYEEGLFPEEMPLNRVEIIAEIKGFLDLIEQKIGYR